MTNLDRILFPHLIQELRDYAKERHAESVYIKCIRNGKYLLADKIAKKYHLHRPYDKRQN